MCDDRFEFSSVIHGHHVYKDIFTHAIRKILQSRREADNSYDSFAVAIIKDDTNVVGSVRFIYEEKRDNIVRGNWPSSVLKGFGKGGLDVVSRGQTILSRRGVIACCKR